MYFRLEGLIGPLFLMLAEWVSSTIGPFALSFRGKAMSQSRIHRRLIEPGSKRAIDYKWNEKVGVSIPLHSHSIKEEELELLEPLPPRRKCIRQQPDNLNHLRRWLHSRVGQPWNEVFSALCADAKSPLHRRHLLSHVFQYVIEKPLQVGENFVVDHEGNRLPRRDYFLVVNGMLSR